MNTTARSLRRRTPAAVSLVGSESRLERGLLGKVAGSELARAVSGVDFPIMLAWDESGTIRLANSAAAELFGGPLEELVGMNVVDLAGPPAEVKHTIKDMATGQFVAVHTRRTIHVRNGPGVPVCATSRMIEVDGVRGGVTILVPEVETGRAGRHPLRRWLDLVPVAIGYVDDDWIIQMVSIEVGDMLDRTPDELIGTRLLDLMDAGDAEEISAAGNVDGPRSLPQVRFQLPSGGDVEVCLLLAPRPQATGDVRFALVGRIESYYPQQQDRVAELELRLRRIGAEVRAAGLLDMAALPSLQAHPELRQLSARQWEILSLLLDGKRVPQIAEELFISRSTVRNHLAAIFQRFGVHSQTELLQVLLKPELAPNPAG